MKGMLFGVLLGIGIVGSGVCVAGEKREPEVLLPELIVDGPYGKVTFKKVLAPDWVNDPKYDGNWVVEQVRECLKAIAKTDSKDVKTLLALAGQLADFDEIRDELSWVVGNYSYVDEILGNICIRLLGLGEKIISASSYLDQYKQVFANLLLYNDEPVTAEVISLAGGYVSVSFNPARYTEDVRQKVLQYNKNLPQGNCLILAIKKANEDVKAQRIVSNS
jgi:hypothetical protein